MFWLFAVWCAKSRNVGNPELSDCESRLRFHGFHLRKHMFCFCPPWSSRELSTGDMCSISGGFPFTLYKKGHTTRKPTQVT